MARLKDITLQHDFRLAPTMREVGQLRIGAPHPAIKRCEEQMRTISVANHPEVNPPLYVLGMGSEEQFRPGPGIGLGDVSRLRVGRLKGGLARFVDDLTYKVPVFVRRKVEDLRCAEISIREFQYIPLNGIDVLPIIESVVLDLVRPFPAANCAEQMPLVFVVNNRRVFDRVSLLALSFERPNQRWADCPVESASQQIVHGLGPIGGRLICQYRRFGEETFCKQHCKKRKMYEPCHVSPFTIALPAYAENHRNLKANGRGLWLHSDGAVHRMPYGTTSNIIKKDYQTAK